MGLALLGGLLACLVVDGLGRSLVDRRLLQLTIDPLLKVFNILKFPVTKILVFDKNLMNR